MQIIPLQFKENQTVVTSLNGKNIQISVYQKYTGLYCDIYENNSAILNGILCLDRVPLIQSLYLDFSSGGDLVFIDQQGNQDPYYSGLGSRYLLYYISPQDFQNYVKMPTYGDP